ncbi:tryptophan 7-halogenase [soil metagenome]
MRNHDVLILGGGLAGLTLALQLKSRRPELDVAVVERLALPYPVAAHKVGESTVEIGAHYFSETLGLREHLDDDQLLKFGLRFFFGGSRRGTDLAAYDEVGPSELLPVKTWQLDRGIFENHLAARARRLGVALLDGARVGRVDISSSGADHRATVRTPAGEHTLATRWLVDASGRRALLRRQLGLDKPITHQNSAIWLRLDVELDIDNWSESSAWRSRCAETRRLSTNHLMGPGYWVWLIPLASGATSVGLVFDPRLVALDEVNTYERFLTWLDVNEPLVSAALREHPDALMDFRFLRGYPHNATRVFDPGQWALTGEAGVFADPFYSPGSDFIAIGNTFITELIAATPPAQMPQRAAYYQQIYFSFFSNTLSLFTDQYPGFGDRDLMYLKTVWDYAIYWAVFAKLFFANRMTDVDFMRSAEPWLVESLRLNRDMQRRFASVAARRRSLPAEGRFFDHCAAPWFYQLKEQLVADDQPLLSRLEDNAAKLALLADRLQRLLAASLDGKRLPEPLTIDGLEVSPALERLTA